MSTPCHYWIVVDEEPRGPMTFDEAVAAGITGSTPVWRPGLDDWTEAARVEEFAALLDEPPAAEPPAAPETASAPEAVPPVPAAPVPAVPAVPAAPSPEPPEPAPAPADAPLPVNYLPYAIAATLLCCTPLGIVAIIYAARTGRYIDLGDIEAARRSSETAEWWVIITIVAGLVWMPFSIILALMS